MLFDIALLRPIKQFYGAGVLSRLKIGVESKASIVSRAAFQDHLRKQLKNLLRHEIFILSMLEIY